MTREAVIDLNLARADSLFETLDPSPFHERDIDQKAVDYIVGWAQEYPAEAPFVLRLHLPGDEAALARDGGIAEAIRLNFGYWLDSVNRQRREQFRLGRIYALVGITTLAACLTLRGLLPGLIGDGAGARLLGEGLAILGWVSNWRPVETFLYDWWPLYRRARLFRRLAAAKVEIVSP